jgi:hypothetical protein
MAMVMSRWQTFRTKLAGARQYTPGELALVPVALLLLGLARLTIAVLPLRLWLGWLGQQMPPEGTALPVSHRQDQRARSIGRSVRATASVTPWRADCLPQAMAAALLLRLARVPYVLTIGQHRSMASDWPNTPMQAHAWITAGERLVTGGPADPSLQPLLSFAG